jgi:CubicO group peptidase (beta-lactamase class C family)
MVWALVVLAACSSPPEAKRETQPPARQAPAAHPAAPAPPERPRTASPADAGMSERLVPDLEAVMASAIAGRATPGGAIAVGRNGRLVVSRGYGRTDWAAGAPAVTDSTLYDLASLSKVVATTTAAMMLVERRQLDLDRPVARYLPGFHPRITPRMLLTHTSGIRSNHHLYRETRGREEYLKHIIARPLARAPGTRSVYDDWNMIVLQLVIERITGQPLDRWVGEHIFAPLGMRDTRYNPAASLRPRVAPTEIQEFRGGKVWGEVHDENAWALGGVAGHAGLFSSARDMAVFATMMLNGGEHGGVRLLRAETIARWTTPQLGASTRALGWDTRAGRVFGHMGYTGTSIWMYPEQDLFIILLTNRVNPSRENRKIAPLRAAVTGTVRRSIVR